MQPAGCTRCPEKRLPGAGEVTERARESGGQHYGTDVGALGGERTEVENSGWEAVGFMVRYWVDAEECCAAGNREGCAGTEIDERRCVMRKVWGASVRRDALDREDADAEEVIFGG